MLLAARSKPIYWRRQSIQTCRYNFFHSTALCLDKHVKDKKGLLKLNIIKVENEREFAKALTRLFDNGDINTTVSFLGALQKSSPLKKAAKKKKEDPTSTNQTDDDSEEQLLQGLKLKLANPVGLRKEFRWMHSWFWQTLVEGRCPYPIEIPMFQDPLAKDDLAQRIIAAKNALSFTIAVPDEIANGM